jgi:hypothetical protein
MIVRVIYIVEVSTFRNILKAGVFCAFKANQLLELEYVKIGKKYLKNEK